MAPEALPPVVVDSLALAVVVASDAPTLLLDGDFAVLATSSSFLRAFKTNVEAIQGRAVFDVGAGEWDVPQLRTFLKLALTGAQGVDGYEMDLRPPGAPGQAPESHEAPRLPACAYASRTVDRSRWPVWCTSDRAGCR